MAKRRPNRPPSTRLARIKRRSTAGERSSSIEAIATSLTDDEAVALVMELMSLPGKSGSERPLVECITNHLRRANAPASAIQVDDAHRRAPSGGQVGNLILKIPGTLRRPRRLLVAHLDTVPICLGSQPSQRGQWIHSADPHSGVGADDRAGSAVLLTTALAILRDRLPCPPLTFLWSVQEEVGMVGVRHARLGLLGRPRLAFNFDGGTPQKLTIGATGGYHMEIEIKGRAAHAGNQPEEGVSAIAIAALAVADLVRDGWHGQVRKGASRGTSNVGTIDGGSATNVVADRVRLRVEARSHQPKFRHTIVRAFEKAFQRAAIAVRNAEKKCGQVHVRSQLEYESFRLARSEACVEAATAAVCAEGLDPIYAVAQGGLDANWLTARGIPTVSLGCGQTDIHTVDDRLDVKGYQRARRIALRLATDGSSHW